MFKIILLTLLSSASLGLAADCGKTNCTPYLNALEGCTYQVGITSNVTLLQSCICPNGRFDGQVKTCYSCAQSLGNPTVSDGIGLFLNYCANYTGPTGTMQSGISSLQRLIDGREC
jgi:hypothetical protein